jgi:hypothetical protein
LTPPAAERETPDERPIMVDVGRPPAVIAGEVVAALKERA